MFQVKDKKKRRVLLKGHNDNLLYKVQESVLPPLITSPTVVIFGASSSSLFYLI